MRSESGMHATAVIASTSSADELCGTAATRREEETAETAKIAKKKVFSASLAFSAVFSYPSPD